MRALAGRDAEEASRELCELATKKFTGQRFCHVSALKWSDIEWSNMLIRFRRKQVRGFVGPIPRRKPAPKEIPMLPELATALMEHGRRLGKLATLLGSTIGSSRAARAR